MTEELLLEINRDFLRHFQGARNNEFPPELAKLEIGGISEQVYSVLRKIFSEYEGTYSKRIETFLGDKNSSCLSGINTYPFGEPTNDIYRDFFGICAERSNLDPILDEALRHCELVLNHYEAEDRKAVIILTNKWNDYKFHKKYFSEFLRYALIENVIFVFLLYSDYAVTLIPFLPLNRYDFESFRRTYLKRLHEEGLKKNYSDKKGKVEMSSSFSVYNASGENIISWLRQDEVAIPEIQRPFVWEAVRVRDLMDSLYKGYPIGYIILWRNPDTKLKNGGVSKGKRILIDGQQRTIALKAAILGDEVVDSNYAKKTIQISFNPLEERFEVLNPALAKNSAWINDISKVFESDFNLFSFTMDYCKANGITGKEAEVSQKITKLIAVKGVNIGITELDSNLDIDEVTEIFIRINSQGVSLSQADFAMSKISSDNNYSGNEMRKMIDYFCHFMKSPSDYDTILKNDTIFAKSDARKKIDWAVNQQDNIYVPSYVDVLRVSFTHMFHRGKLSDLVSLLSGRDFEKRIYSQDVEENSFKMLRAGVEAFVNQTNFERYLMILHSVGIVSVDMIRSQNVLNFGYILYLSLKAKKLEASLIENIVRRWVVLSILTGRYSGSADSAIEYDIKKFTEQDPVKFLEDTEAGELSNAFWNNVLITNLETSSSSSPSFLVFLMAQVKKGARGFLSKTLTVRELIEMRGDIHHLFPKKYLQDNKITSRRDYNQIANYVYTQSEVNIKIKDKSPSSYMSKARDMISQGKSYYSGISDIVDLEANLAENCVPVEFMDMQFSQYQEFLERRRKLMAEYILDYYENL